LLKLRKIYEREFSKLKSIVIDKNKVNWRDYSEEEKLTVRVNVLLVGLLYKMCQVTLVKKTETDNGVNSVNVDAIEKCMNDVNKTLENADLNINDDLENKEV
jgi:hypothetical protein